jgi:hypothetical protein
MSVIALVVTQNGWACDMPDGPCDHDEDAPEAAIEDGANVGMSRGADVALSYDVQYFPDRPGHHLALRITGDDDSYVGGELRYLPGSDMVATGRAGAGFDLFGRGKFDFTLGLWIGAAGEWDRKDDIAVLYAVPTIGTEMGIGYDGRHFFSKWRWAAGLGAGPVDELLSESEFTFGYKIGPGFHVYGQWVVLRPGELEDEAGAGLGARVVF